MRWYDVAALGCLVIGVLFLLFVAVLSDVARKEPTPVPYVTPTPRRYILR